MDNTENAHSTNPLDLPGINDDPTAAQREVYLAKPDLQVTPTSDPNPWIPIQNPLDLKHLGKLIEELNEAGSATARCIIQGIDEVEPHLASRRTCRCYCKHKSGHRAFQT
jgi:hypothetical protein